METLHDQTFWQNTCHANAAQHVLQEQAHNRYNTGPLVKEPACHRVVYRQGCFLAQHVLTDSDPQIKNYLVLNTYTAQNCCCMYHSWSIARGGYLLLSVWLSNTFFICEYFSFFVFPFLYYFFSLHPGMFIFFVSLRLCSSHLPLSASTYFIVRVLPACCAICTLPHLGILLFFYSSTCT